MEVSHVAVRTRARAMMMPVAEETPDNSGPAKRRKVGNENFRSPNSSTFVQTESLDREINVNSELEEGPCASCDASTSLRSGCVPACCWPSTGSMEELKVADLEEESVETETPARHNLDESESTPTSDFKKESGELDPTTKQSSTMSDSCRTIVMTSEKMSFQAEVDEFFAVAQEDLTKRFKDKYNYDVVNDIPLKGRFEWIQLQPGDMTVDGDNP